MAVVSYGNRVVEVVALDGLEGVMMAKGKETMVVWADRNAAEVRRDEVDEVSQQRVMK